MIKVLIVSFDLIKEGEVKKSLSIASLLAFLKADKRYGCEFIVEHISFNLSYKAENIDYLYENQINLEQIDVIALSAYVWCEHLINPLLRNLRAKGFTGKIILGGYQITYSSKAELSVLYPDCDIFITGYAEESLLDAIFMNATPNKPIINKEINCENIPPIYSSGEISVSPGQEMIRLETKRGCLYKCTYCAHRDLVRSKIYEHSFSKVIMELDYLKRQEVRKINIIDPIFNVGNNYLEIIREMRRLKLNSLVSFQSRFELLHSSKGHKFLDLLCGLNSHLEFGVQSVIEDEYKLLNRQNDVKLIESVIQNLNKRDLSYEVSLIYGLPNQTVTSFKQSIDFLLSKGCFNIKAYPLMLLRGTELYAKKQKWGLKEKRNGELNIPVVVESNSFSESDWLEMKKIADNLSLAYAGFCNT